MPPAARVTDMHVCPMVTGIVPHVGGPILPPGVPTVLVGFLPAATVTDMLTCVGPPDVIAKGSAGVFINFLPAARMGDMTAHGGVIILGEPTVIIGEIGTPSPGAGGLGGIMAGLSAAGGAIKSGLESIAKLAVAATAVVVDYTTKQVAEVAAYALAGNQTARQWLLTHAPSDTTQAPYDGKVIGAGCQPTEPSTAATAAGIRPAGCPAGTTTIPRVYFMNGINTKVYGEGASMCATMQHIANQTCAEVVGIYGAAKGMASDLEEATQEVEKNANSAQAKTLASLVTNSAGSDPPQDLNLIAHSRGALATQQGLSSAKAALTAKFLGLTGDPDAAAADVDSALSHVNVSSYGSAEQGWPTGPEYTKSNNSYDPVPAAIKGAQANFPEATLGDNDTTPTVLFSEPKLNPIDAHSVDGVYVNHMTKASGPRDCNCS